MTRNFKAAVRRFSVSRQASAPFGNLSASAAVMPSSCLTRSARLGAWPTRQTCFASGIPFNHASNLASEVSFSSAAVRSSLADPQTSKTMSAVSFARTRGLL